MFFKIIDYAWLIFIISFSALMFLIAYKLYLYIQYLFVPFKKGKSYWCKVVDVSDGDTLTCYRFNIRRSETKIRFAYIDAPETKQSYGKESQMIVKKFVYRRLVRISITDVDRYGRCVGVIS